MNTTESSFGNRNEITAVARWNEAVFINSSHKGRKSFGGKFWAELSLSSSCNSKCTSRCNQASLSDKQTQRGKHTSAFLCLIRACLRATHSSSIQVGEKDEAPAGSTRGSGGFQFHIRQIRVCSVWMLFLLECCCVTASTQSKSGVSN